jgi:hypothetical protein
MGEAFTFRFEMTGAEALAANTPLEQVLWLQNERFYQSVSTPMGSRERLRRFAMGLAAVALGFCTVLAVWSWPDRRYLRYGALFLVLFLLLRSAGAVRGWLRRLARWTTAGNAARMTRFVAARAPYTIEYSLTDGELTTRVENLGLVKVLALKEVRLAVVGANLVCLFQRDLAQTPERVLHLPGPTELERVRAALVAAGVEVREL